MQWIFSKKYLGRNTVPDTTWNSKKQIWALLRLKLVFISIINAHFSSDSNNSLCPEVQYVSTANPLHYFLATNLAT